MKKIWIDVVPEVGILFASGGEIIGVVKCSFEMFSVNHPEIRSTLWSLPWEILSSSSSRVLGFCNLFLEDLVFSFCGLLRIYY